MSPPIRLGVIGLSSSGWAATSLIPPLFDPLLSDKYTITAVATRSETSAQASATKYSELTGHKVKGYYGENGAKDLANDSEVDLVVVSVKIPDHWKAVKPAIDAGKDIFVEWSPGRSLEETAKMAEAAKAKGVRTIVGAQSSHSATIRKMKELVDSGKVGKVISTNLVRTSLVLPSVLKFIGKTSTEDSAYALDINNDATLLTILTGHHLTNLSYILGELKEVSATTAILFPNVQIVDANGKATGEIIKKTAPDQVILTGTLGGRHDGAIVTVHIQAGAATGRFLWFIDGEDGVIEVKNRPENGPQGVFVGFNEMKLLLNNEEVGLDQREEDRLRNTGKAWLEFAKGDKGQYETLEHSVVVWRVLDAAFKSIADGGRKIAVA
ncbi:oxidoreductase [Irpex rosettiformis]|uniref:Oxidoreductase n=1 Tax=Irpex rosettiformis TaxID=378272 RepID=A0ACB8UB80_9APHY|nr:oxidoreductase [Irpex rosettiformis]